MFAASSLVVAVLATYASVAVLSLSASAPSFLGSLPGVHAVVTGIGWHKPSVGGVVKLKNPPATAGLGALADSNLIDFGSVSGTSGPRTLSITNNSSTGLALQVYVLGAGAQGVTAEFQNHTRTTTVAPGEQATVYLASSPMFAGPINGQLEISAPGLTPKFVPIHGAQAPLPAGAVTATPAANGAVDLSWAPSPSSGVAGYLIQRAPSGSTAFQTVSTPVTGTTAVDQTPTDGPYSYQVVAVAQGTDALQSAPGASASATSDSTAPLPPDAVNPPTYINIATGNAMQIPVNLANDSVPTDTITVKLTDVNGVTVSGQASGGGASASVQVAGLNQLAEGKIKVTATATDSLGNPSNAASANLIKDTSAPAAPTLGDLPMITADNQEHVSIQVFNASLAQLNDVVTVQLSQGQTTLPAQSAPPEANGDTSAIVTQDASSLADGNVSVSATVTDAAGNTSDPVTGTMIKDVNGAAKPTTLTVAAGPNNPAGVVTAASQTAVSITAQFAQAPDAADQIKIVVADTAYPITPDGTTTAFSLGPLDLSSLPDGHYPLKMVITDSNGVVSTTYRHFTKDASGPTAPTSVGVPAGPNNPAGYVNAATQTAATIVAAFAGPTDPADQIALSVNNVQFAPQSGGSDQAVFTGDLSSLPDGTLQILGTITDPSGVSTSFSGTLIKDTQPPPAPAAAYVVGPPPNTISPADASCVKVAVAFNQAPDPSDMVTVTLSDENTSVQGSAPAGDGQVEIGCIDASSLSAGTIAVNVTVTDAAGNSTSVAGTDATKLPCQPS